ncbi:inner membrane CreD family protein [Deltaproteobacteria bacterium TL4]
MFRAFGFRAFGLIGLALCLFFLLLLSLSEHLGFLAAYLIASLSTILLNTFYCMAVMKKRLQTFIFMGVLTALYVILYFLLQMQDYALVVGSMVLFTALSASMFATRNITVIHAIPEKNKEEAHE